MSVAVLIVNYRAYDALERALRSLARHSAAGDQIVVVDYESDAASLQRAVNGLPNVTATSLPGNRGFAAGVNTAAAQTTADVLVVLNPDTIVEGPLLRMAEAWAGAHPDVGVVGPRVLDEDGSVQASARRFPGVSTLLGGRSTWLTKRFPDNWFSRANLVGLRASGEMDVDWVSGACLITPRRVFERVNGFDEGFFLYWEDADYCRRVTAAGYRCVYVPGMTVRHVGGVSAEHDLANAIRAFHRSAYRLFWKHSHAAARLAAPLVKAGLWARGELRVRQALRTRSDREPV